MHKKLKKVLMHFTDRYLKNIKNNVNRWNRTKIQKAPVRCAVRDSNETNCATCMQTLLM